MQLKKLLALLLSAALALSLLAGCGGESVARSLLALLDGQYANVSVEMDPDLEADLRQAIRTAESENAGDDAAAIRAALETLLGSKVTFRKLGEGQQGDTAFDLIFYAGADPDKAVQSAYSQWNGTFSNLPDDGLYTAALAQVQTENGVWLLVQATVDKAGTVDKPDKDDDEPEQPEPEDEKVEGNGFTYNVTKKTITVEPDSKGMQELFFSNPDTKVEAARNNGFEDIIITLKTGTYSVNDTFKTPFKGTLQGESGATITLTGGKGLFAQIGEDNSGPENNGTVENITFDVQTKIENTYTDSNYTRAGAVAGLNNGTISNCDVTINASESISITATNKDSYVYAGGIAGENQGRISKCTVNGGNTAPNKDDPVHISADNERDGFSYAGGIVGRNQGTVEDCSVSYCRIEAEESGYGYIIAAGGIVGWSSDKEKVNCKSATDCYITAKVGSNEASVPDPTDTDTPNTDTKGNACAGTRIGLDNKTGRPVG